MSKDGTSGKRRVSDLERAILWTLGSILKIGGILGILAGLLGIALSNMDGDPMPDIVSGGITVCVGLVMVYFGHKMATKAKSL
jgi:hypothetical protein